MSLDPRRNPASSPCVGECSLAFGGDICLGCGRTVAEVLNWGSLTNEQKIEVKQVCAERLRTLHQAKKEKR